MPPFLFGHSVPFPMLFHMETAEPECYNSSVWKLMEFIKEAS